jgi:hypothetical protein
VLHDEVIWDDGVSAAATCWTIFNVAGTHHAQCNQGRIQNDLAVVATRLMTWTEETDSTTSEEDFNWLRRLYRGNMSVPVIETA